MNNTVERLLYVSLALIVFGVVIAVIVLFSFGHKLDTELQQLKTIQDQQVTTIDTLQRGVNDIKANNAKNTQLIECLINLHAAGVVTDSGSCQVRPAASSSTAPAPASPNTPSSPKTAPAPSPQPVSPAPKPHPLVCTITLGLVGCK